MYRNQALYIGRLHPLTDDKILDQSNLKELADDSDSKIENCFGKCSNIVGKGENAGFQHFSPFPTMFSKGLSLRVV